MWKNKRHSILKGNKKQTFNLQSHAQKNFIHRKRTKKTTKDKQNKEKYGFSSMSLEVKYESDIINHWREKNEILNASSGLNIATKI